MTLSEAFAVFVRYFFILTPFFVVAVFIALTENETDKVRHDLAIRITAGLCVLTLLMLFCGEAIFSLFGITVEAFRVGAGALLFLSAVSLVNGKVTVPESKRSIMDLAIVPLAIPVTLGPGAIGVLFVIGSETSGLRDRLLTCLALLAAVLCVGAILYLSSELKRIIGRSGISMLSKLTGLVLAALSSQMIFSGIATFFK
jgi:multiple antibiotic resistance protein